VAAGEVAVMNFTDIYTYKSLLDKALMNKDSSVVRVTLEYAEPFAFAVITLFHGAGVDCNIAYIYFNSLGRVDLTQPLAFRGCYKAWRSSMKKVVYRWLNETRSEYDRTRVRFARIQRELTETVWDLGRNKHLEAMLLAED
jgi:hypothetical protein